MPLSDLPLTILVALFLVVFVLIGIQPALQRAAEKIRKLVHSAVQPEQPAAAPLADAYAEIFVEQKDAGPLNDFEIIVLRRFAQDGGKALTRKQVNAPLLLDTEVLRKTLKSLYRRDMIQVVMVSTLLGQRFVLSEAGYRYAVEQGYICKIEERKGALG